MSPTEIAQAESEELTDYQKARYAIYHYNNLRASRANKPPDEYHELVQQLSGLGVIKNEVKVTSLQCCGFKEIAGISQVDPELALEVICLQIEPGADSAYILFTQADEGHEEDCGDPDCEDCCSYCEPADYGYDFANFLTKHALGEVKVVAGPMRNPNSGNQVTMWAWHPDPGAVKRWFCDRHPVLGPVLYGAKAI